MSKFYQEVPLVYTLDDHDSGPDNSDGRNKATLESV
jgi:hypothetical protein